MKKLVAIIITFSMITGFIPVLGTPTVSAECCHSEVYLPLALNISSMNGDDPGPPITLRAIINRLESDFAVMRNCTQCGWIRELEKAILREYIRSARNTYNLATIVATTPLIALLLNIPIGQLTWGSLATYLVIESIFEHHDFPSMAPIARDLLQTSLGTALEAARFMRTFPCYPRFDPNHGGGTPPPRPFTLTENTTFNSLIANGNIDLNGFTMTVNGDFTANGIVDLNGGELIVNGDFVSNRRVHFHGGQMTANGDFTVSSIAMANENDYLLVMGDFAVSGAYNSTFQLTAGTVELRGDFSQTRGNAFVYISSGTHRTIFSGTGRQEIYFADPSRNRFNILELRNTSQEGVVFTTNVTVATLFNHNRNNFTLTAGGTFPDFDGDGIRDNLDPFPLDPYNNPLLLDITELSVCVNNIVSVEIFNRMLVPINGFLFVTVSNGQGAMTDSVLRQNISFVENDYTIIDDILLNNPLPNEYTIRAFIWENLNNMNPLSTAKEI